MSDFPSVSVVIPVWNAEPYLETLLSSILKQELVQVTEILLLDSMSTDRTAEISATFPSAAVIPEPDFSHGGTRNRGIGMAKEDFVILMTQDALPKDNTCFAHLIAAFENPDVAYAFSRQIPYPKTNPMECYYLQEKFPAESSRMYQSGGDPVTSPDQSFSSNVCSSLRKSVWEQHPFREDLIMGEDQEFSCQVQQAGYSVAYVADSVVIHSHNYSLLTLFRRYFDSVVGLNQLFPKRDLKDNATYGILFIQNQVRYLWNTSPLWLFYFPLFLGTQAMATLLAHRIDSLPNRLKLWCSLNRSYWTI
jgi:rhamnosyltransferase